LRPNTGSLSRETPGASTTGQLRTGGSDACSISGPRVAARVASETTVGAAVGARDSDGVPRLREVGADGHVFEGSEIALGTGAETALGRLETVGSGADAEDLGSTARDVVELVMERDTATGDDVDVWSLSGDPGTSTDAH